MENKKIELAILKRPDYRAFINMQTLNKNGEQQCRRGNVYSEKILMVVAGDMEPEEVYVRSTQHEFKKKIGVTEGYGYTEVECEALLLSNENLGLQKLKEFLEETD